MVIRVNDEKPLTQRIKYRGENKQKEIYEGYNCISPLIIFLYKI